MASTKKRTLSDVATPSAPLLAPSSTSRSIIVKHAPVKDLTINETPKADLPTPEPVPVTKPSAKKLNIQPLSPRPEATEPKLEAVPVVIKSEPKPEPVVEEPVIDRSARVAELVTSQELFLPIETVEQRRSKRALLIGAVGIGLLLLAWYNVALDANLLPNIYNLPHTSFFRAK